MTITDENEKYNLPCPYDSVIKCVQFPEAEADKCGCDPCKDCNVYLERRPLMHFEWVAVNDKDTCEPCKQRHGKVKLFKNMEIVPLADCKNPDGCRCYVKHNPRIPMDGGNDESTSVEEKAGPL